MKVALAHWQGRISPVFDVTRNLLVIELELGKEVRRNEDKLSYRDPFSRARQVSRLGVDVLICGAISRHLEIALTTAGVQVVPYTCGQVEDVFKAFLNGGLTEDLFL